MYKREKTITYPTPPRDWLEVEKAYLAGVLDCEGSITVMHRKPSQDSRNRWEYWTLRVLVTNTNCMLVEWLRERCGGNICTSVSKVPNRRDLHQWRLESKRAQPILELVLPYLLLKKRQAELALDFLSTYKLAGSKGHKEDTIDKRCAICEEIKSLNRLGKI